MSLKALKANRLSDGVAIWYTTDGKWSEDVSTARVEEGKDGVALLQTASDDANKACLIVDSEIIDIVIEDGVPAPKKLKERIRALGPTVRLDLGKQAQPSAPSIQKVA